MGEVPSFTSRSISVMAVFGIEQDRNVEQIGPLFNGYIITACDWEVKNKIKKKLISRLRMTASEQEHKTFYCIHV